MDRQTVLALSVEQLNNYKRMTGMCKILIKFILYHLYNLSLYTAYQHTEHCVLHIPFHLLFPIMKRRWGEYYHSTNGKSLCLGFSLNIL